MTGHASFLPSAVPSSDEREFDLDDPFIGLLGQKTGRDELWLGKLVPRYTSYPPATAFQEGVTALDYKAALAALPANDPISLYLHIPFCQSLCLYCGCNTCATQRHERVTNYLGFVLREIQNVALIRETPWPVSFLHFGGGSPNFLSEKEFGLVFDSLARNFDMSSYQEISVEMDPRLITQAQIKTLSMLGVTRVSLGVQDFDPNVQHIIGRLQSYELVKAACALIRNSEIRSINFDLMYGLPMQSPTSVAETAQEAVMLRPDRISLFSYAHLPHVKKHQKVLEQYILPGPHACLAMEGAARQVFKEAGYVEIGMDHFALPSDSLSIARQEGRLHRNFQGYTDDTASTLLGFGASSIGSTSMAYFQNARSPEAYEEAIRKDGFATTRGLRLSGEDRLRAEIIETLMCTLCVNLEEVCRKHHYALATLSEEIEALKPYEQCGIVSRQGNTISLALPYRMAVRVIASLFDKTVRRIDTPVSRAV
ncbi:MAG: oxygen-independent coproporphyrinogen III oxidase [Alphaproteobacteria bacterium]|nr:oxygen-independent coproporphyrinogen III oxidase [Alphaproteobacteria bacterium]